MRIDKEVDMKDSTMIMTESNKYSDFLMRKSYVRTLPLEQGSKSQHIRFCNSLIMVDLFFIFLLREVYKYQRRIVTY